MEKECINYVGEIVYEAIQHRQIFNEDNLIGKLMELCREDSTFNKKEKEKVKKVIKLIKEKKIIPWKLK